jgi:UDP-3-O-[3-hydroxymyristoyl] N-acetylglucosamine deacetylase
MLQKNGLALGGSLDNAVVVGDRTVLNEGGLRFPDEFVRHKVLDLIGDLYLLGAPMVGRVRAWKSGHHLHHLLAKELLRLPFAWRFVEEGAPWVLPVWAASAGDGVSRTLSV